MEVPPHVLKKGLFSIVNKNIYYPAPLLDSWIKSTQPPLDSPSGLYRLSLSLSLSLSLTLSLSNYSTLTLKGLSRM
jgi:cohesin complex subunit SCC1